MDYTWMREIEAVTLENNKILRTILQHINQKNQRKKTDDEVVQEVARSFEPPVPKPPQNDDL